MPVRRVWPETVYRRVMPGSDQPTFAQVVEISRPSGGTSIHVAGTFPADVDMVLVGAGDMAVQVAAALENIRRSLEAVGAGIDDIVRIKLYTTDLAWFGRDGRAEFRKFFGDSAAASTAVQVSALAMPGALVEFEAYAELV